MSAGAGVWRELCVLSREWSYRQKKIRVSPTCGIRFMEACNKLRERISIWIH